MRALVTGGAGFIGSHLCDRLVADGWDVTGIDNCSTGHIRNLANVTGNEDRHFTFIMGSVARILRGWPACKYDVVFHLAARIGPEYVVKDRLAMMREHSRDTMAVIRICRQSGARLLFTSTSEVYGANTKEPFLVDDTMTLGPVQHPRWAYAVSKLACEHAIMGAVEKHGVSAVIARLFNVVGPRQSDKTGLVLPSFAGLALRGRPLIVHGDGSQRRCFSHVRDVIQTLVRLASESTNRVVNVGSAETRTIAQVAADVVRHVEDRYGVLSHVEFVPWDAVPERPSNMGIRVPGAPELDGETQWPEIVADVCAWQAGRLGIERVEVAA